MILDKLVTPYTKATTRDGAGYPTDTFTAGSAFRANVQPAQLTQAQITEWGLQDTASNAKKLFAETYKVFTIADRISVDGRFYEIRGVNTWGNHNEAILIPVQGI